MNINLVGAGYWGSKIKAELDQITDVSNVTVYDIKQNQTIDDIENNDPVILATPLWQNKKQTIELLKRGHDVYVEKPMAETAEDIQEISQYHNDQVLMVGHIFLYNPLIHELKKLIDDGELGEINHIESRRLNWGIRQTQTTPLLSLAPHDVSIIDFLYSKQMGTVQYANASNLSQNNVPDMVEFGNHKFNIKVSWYWPKRERIVTVIGDMGQAVWDEDKKTIEVYYGQMDGKYPVKEPKTRTINYNGKNPLHYELAHFVECCQTRNKPRSDLFNAFDIAQKLDHADLLLK